MNKLPFTIKTTDQLTTRLCRFIPPEQHQELNVDVQFLLRSWELYRLPSLGDSVHYTLTQQIPSEVQKDAYETFIRFLRGVTEQELFLPTEHLSRYPHRQYCLLLSPSRVRELFEVYNPSLRYSQRLVSYRGYNLIVDKGSQLSDTEAYLIAPSKYTLFLRQVHDGNEIKIYRSDFVDLTGNTPPPPRFTCSRCHRYSSE